MATARNIAVVRPGNLVRFAETQQSNELCELMIALKLLLLICGSKDQYRQLRDLHTLETRIREIIVGKGGFDFIEGGSVNLLYDTLIQLIEQLKSCVEVAESRTLN